MYHNKERETIIVDDAFEVSSTSAAVIAAKGPLVRRFPGQSVAIPHSMIDDNTFCPNIAEELFKLSAKIVPEMQPKSTKSKNFVSEERDTIHPGLVTEGLMTQLLAFGEHNNWTSFEKHMRDEVNWDNCKLPWRRSPQWAVLRIALQTILQRAFLGCEGLVQYKNFMLYLVAEIGTVVLKHPITSDRLAFVRAKIGRRIYKMGDNVYDFVADHAQSSDRRLMDSLRAIQSDIIESDKIFVPRCFRAAREEDLKMTLNHSRQYLRAILQQKPTTAEPTPFKRQYTQRNRRNEHGLPILDSGNPLSLFDMELWVERYLKDWIQDVDPSEDRCCSLAELLQKYASIAPQENEGSPDELFSMFLVMLELWMAIDTISTAICPMLND